MQCTLSYASITYKHIDITSQGSVVLQVRVWSGATPLANLFCNPQIWGFANLY